MRLVLALLFTVTAASAQQMQQFDKPFEPSLNNDTPTVVTQYNKNTGEVAGTTTIVGGKAYLRDKNGEHYATLIIDKDGTRRMIDPQGQPIDAAKIKERLEEAK